MEQKLHTPEGVRDIYHRECAVKLELQNRVSAVFHQYGYQDIQTPTFEYYDVFREEIGSTSAKETYKFFDREGNILALRPDITPSVARAAATLLDAQDETLRLCYAGNTFTNYTSYQGRLKENTQLGAELIGEDSAAADAEMLSIVEEVLKKAGLSEFQISIGHAAFVQSLLDAADLTDEERGTVRAMIDNRNFFGALELMEGRDVDPKILDVFGRLPELAGGREVLDIAAQIAPNEKAALAVGRLAQIYDLLGVYHAQDHLTFDLSMIGNYMYYTGIIFRAYTYGTGASVVRGGRYDQLMEKFGRSTPSVGLAVMLDELLAALGRQDIPVKTGSRDLLVYAPSAQKQAIALSVSLRKSGRNVELIRKQAGRVDSDYVEMGKQSGAANIMFMSADKSVEMVNLKSGKTTAFGGRKKA